MLSLRLKIFTKMKKLTCLFMIVALICSCAFVSAQSVSKSEADMVASRFVSEKYMAMSKAPVEVRFQETYADEDMTYMYRYDIGDKGFVIVSASKAVPTVLAYSLDQNFEMIPPVRDLFELYKNEIRSAETAKLLPTSKAAAQWAHYTADEFVPNPPKGNVNNYLLTTLWNQNKYYNTYCPWDPAAGSYYDYRVPNGCVALACAQIMNYHHYPKSGTGAISYIPMGYPAQTVVFPHHTYHWEAMYDEPMSYANEIAKLAYHIGVAIQMNYSADGSGAATERAKDKLRETFHYDPSITSYYRNSYPDSTSLLEYVAALKEQIDMKRPVYYAGCSQSSCHAYVLDGYDNEEKFHLNYGWGGASNGFYEMDNFTSGYTHWDYNFSGEAIMNIFPARSVEDEYCQGHKRLTASFGYVLDGSPTAKPYQANPDCSWMVATPDARVYRFSFDRLDLNPDVDFVTIYNGPTVESGVKATFSGTNPPTNEIAVVADSVLITFTSNGNGPAENTDYYGFQIQYYTTLNAQTCQEYGSMSDWTGVISDGSEEGTDYRPQTNCNWTVSLNFISGFSIAFPKFDLGYGDFVDVYNATTTPHTLYKRYDIYNPPTGIDMVSFNKMRVNFVSDNWDQGNGFNLQYYAQVGVDNYSGLDDMSIYPNPATDNLFLKFSMQNESKVVVKMLDMAGKTVLVDAFEGVIGENLHTLNVSNVKSGLYVLQIETGNGRAIQKVLVQ